MEPALALNLSFEAVEQVAFELCNLAAAKACHVDMIPLRAPFVKVLFPLHVHEVELINQAVTLEKIQGAIDGDSIDAWIESPRLTEDLRGIEMLLRGFNHAKNGSSLMGHPQAA